MLPAERLEASASPSVNVEGSAIASTVEVTALGQFQACRPDCCKATIQVTVKSANHRRAVHLCEILYDEGKSAGEQALNALEGKPVEKKLMTGSTVATTDNLKDPGVAKYVYSFTCPAE